MLITVDVRVMGKDDCSSPLHFKKRADAMEVGHRRILLVKLMRRD